MVSIPHEYNMFKNFFLHSPKEITNSSHPKIKHETIITNEK